MPPAGGERSAVRKNQYNLHIRLDEDERTALEKGLQASGLPLSAYQKMRGLSMNEVKRTNGRIDFEDALLQGRGV